MIFQPPAAPGAGPRERLASGARAERPALVNRQFVDLPLDARQAGQR